MRHILTAAAMLFAATPAWAADTPNENLKAFAYLAGSCWEGPFPDGKSTDQHCYTWIQEGSYLRDQHQVIGANPPYYGETTYYWDHDAKVVKYIYWSKGGGYSTGSAIPHEGGVKYPDERYVGPEGEILVRAESKKIDENSYQQHAEMKGKDGTWTTFVNSTYKRKPLKP
ncbi:MAG: hypothetical protein JNK21_13275 [Rhodospirillaceae bacterium]|nr:hypothetical protein [Rhodospirillaceae bacterium]